MIKCFCLATSVALLLTSSLPPVLTAEVPGAKQPNILLIITDDQGWGDLGCHGNEKINTPHLDKLARESAEFTRFYVSPVCAPTRASLMTGRYNYRTGAVDTYRGRAMMHADETTLAEMLVAAGYRTGIFGKWHLGDNYPLRAMDQGFQESLVHGGGGIKQQADPPQGNSYQDPWLWHNGKLEKQTGYCSDVYADAAMKFIEQRGEKPFLAYVAFNCPHTPLEVKGNEHEKYIAAGLPPDTAKVYAMVENVDENVGRLLAKLDELKLAENTIVIFLTDNGPQFARYNGGLRGHKGSVYEGGVRTAFFLHWPGKTTPGQQIATPAAHIDVTPTLAAAAGAKLPDDKQIDGRDLSPLLTAGGEKAWQPRTLFLQWHRGDVPEAWRGAAAIGPQYKLVQAAAGGEGPLKAGAQKFELFDIMADPLEKHDLLTNKDKPEIFSALKREYETWFHSMRAERNFARPRIKLGAPQENPALLTRQEWRGPNADWRPPGLGYWEVDLAAGQYEISAVLPPGDKPRIAELIVGDKLLGRVEVLSGAKHAAFDLPTSGWPSFGN